MGTRFLAVLAVMALGAGSAMVGLTMAQGSWNVAGDGLAPGQGYALNLGDQADRLKLDLANLTGDATATFSVYGPDGARAGYYSLDANTRSAEVVAGSGTWMVFVYKAQGGDLTLSWHGSTDAGKFAAANVDRHETVLGTVDKTQAVDADYTAVLEKEPVLANVVLQGSAQNFQSELHSKTGVVEVVTDTVVDGVQSGGIVDAKGERTTLPQNLAAGPYTAKVKADSLSGSLVLVSYDLSAPDFPTADHGPDQAPDAPQPASPPPDDGPSGAPSGGHGSHHGAKPSHAGMGHAAAGPAFADCGQADAFVPYAVTVSGGPLKLTLNESQDPEVSVFTPDDHLLTVVGLKQQGDSKVLDLAVPGDYVLFARGGSVEVGLANAADCQLAKLKLKEDVVAKYNADALLGGADEKLNFSLDLPPLAFALRLTGPDAAAVGLEGTFTGPKGEADREDVGLGAGATGGDLVPFGGLFGGGQGQDQGSMGPSGSAMDAKKMVDGAWDLHLTAQAVQGEVDVLAAHYVRADASGDGSGA